MVEERCSTYGIWDAERGGKIAGQKCIFPGHTPSDPPLTTTLPHSVFSCFSMTQSSFKGTTPETVGEHFRSKS